MSVLKLLISKSAIDSPTREDRKHVMNEVFADFNLDGVVNLMSEMNYAYAYYASSFDKSGLTDYYNLITKAYIEGRQIITEANGNLIENFEVLGTSMMDELKVDTIRDKGGNGITLYTSIVPDTDLQYDLGAPTKRFKDL